LEDAGVVLPPALPAGWRDSAWATSSSSGDLEGFIVSDDDDDLAAAGQLHASSHWRGSSQERRAEADEADDVALLRAAARLRTAPEHEAFKLYLLHLLLAAGPRAGSLPTPGVPTAAAAATSDGDGGSGGGSGSGGEPGDPAAASQQPAQVQVPDPRLLAMAADLFRSKLHMQRELCVSSSVWVSATPRLMQASCMPPHSFLPLPAGSCKPCYWRECCVTCLPGVLATAVCAQHSAPHQCAHPTLPGMLQALKACPTVACRDRQHAPGQRCDACGRDRHVTLDLELTGERRGGGGAAVTVLLLRQPPHAAL
jgi:hypothetical protein